MGTRADFYVRKNQEMKWLGSKGYDGYPDGIEDRVLKSSTIEEFEAETIAFLKSQDDSTFPDEGWPWPWNDSKLTDYAYIFENGKVMASNYGYPLFDPLKEEEEIKAEATKLDDYFPNMEAIQNVKFGGKASGLMVISIR